MFILSGIYTWVHFAVAPAITDGRNIYVLFANGIVRIDIAIRPVHAIDYIYATILVKNAGSLPSVLGTSAPSFSICRNSAMIC